MSTETDAQNALAASVSAAASATSAAESLAEATDTFTAKAAAAAAEGVALAAAGEGLARGRTEPKPWHDSTVAGGVAGPSGRSWVRFLADGFVSITKLRATTLEVGGGKLRAEDGNVNDDVGAIGGPSGRSWLVFRKSGKTTIHLAEDSTIPNSLSGGTEVASSRGSETTLDTRLNHGLDAYGAAQDYAGRLWRMRWTRMRMRQIQFGDTGSKLTIALIGDSYTHNRTRWSGVVWKELVELLGDGGVGWVGFSWTSSIGLRNGSVRDDTTVAEVGTWTPNYYGTKSPDLGEISSSTVNNTMTVTFPAGQSSAKLFYIITAGATATAQFNGGGSLQVLDLSTGGTAGDLGIVTLTAPSGSATTLTITVTAGTVTLCGVNILNSSNGVVIHKLAATGSQASHYATASAGASWRAGVASLAPQNVIIMHGTNDQGAGRTTSQFSTDLTTIITNTNTALGATAYDRVVIMPPENQRGLSPTMASYAAAAQPVADSADAVYVNLQPLFGINAADYAFGSARPWYVSDNVHPDPLTGGRVIADAVYRVVANR